ncbi:MAG: DUF2285 domain-containing protein [Pseudomonadota bacterium]
MAEPEHSVDWQKRECYQNLLMIPRRAWAWEILRRNRDFANVWARVDSSPASIARSRASIIKACNEALLEWDCLWADDPGLGCSDATVFWNPRACSSVLRMRALEPSGAAAFELSQIVVPSVLLETRDGMQHVLFRQGSRNLQLVVTGMSIRRPVTLTADVFSSALKPQIRSLSCFHDLLRTGDLLDRYFLADARGARFMLILQALDGWCAGASQREIAIALYGADRVKSLWNDPRSHMRDRVRRIIRRARFLLNGGYRSFLLPVGN